jgi:site-specific recombinase XerD
VGQGRLAASTERDYDHYVRRWLEGGRPPAAGWVAALPSVHARRNGRAALRRYDPALDIPWEATPRRVPRALTDQQLMTVRGAAGTLGPRYLHAVNFLYATGARVGEACGVRADDVSLAGVVLRETKRRPGGLRVERFVPCGRLGLDAAAGLLECRTSRSRPTVIGVGSYQVEAWLRDVGRLAGLRLHPHLLRSTFCTHMLARGADVRVVQELAGHTSIETTMRYLAVTDERLRSAAALLT